MTLLSNAKKEFNNSPIIVSCTVGSFIIAIIMLSFALRSPIIVTNTSSVQGLEVIFDVKNLLFCLAYYIFISLATSSFIRLLYRHYSFTAAFLSIITAVLINFSTYTAINMFPPIMLNTLHLGVVSNLIYGSTLIIFIAVCGQPVVRSLAENALGIEKPNQRVNIEDKKTRTSSNNGVSIVFLLIILSIWGSMVSYGQKSAIHSLLPEVWQPSIKDITDKN
ncbi:hypothetical protein [Psychrobacter sp. GP33]|uniref:hypothetical protein n=1 Tax=Psychrobacter sp. GP33 TaxID=2758709 RepID=UPI0015FC5C75|nr:hypothetical protein [Psychrobacter sp. GP33]